MPHPLYLIPSPYEFWKWAVWIYKRCSGKKDEARWTLDVRQLKQFIALCLIIYFYLSLKHLNLGVNNFHYSFSEI